MSEQEALKVPVATRVFPCLCGSMLKGPVDQPAVCPNCQMRYDPEKFSRRVKTK